MTAREIAEQATILRAVVGSTLHGTNVAETDDRDEMGVCVEPSEYVIGLRRFEQWTHRTQPEGARSGPGDLDLTVYSLRKYAKLALAANPTILLLLHAPPEFCSIRTPLGERLQEQRLLFASKRAASTYRGYIEQQRLRLLGLRGQKRVKRPELEEAYGFDTKYAGHIVRLAFQGAEYLATGHLTLPMTEPQRDVVLAVRTGGYSADGVHALIGELEAELERAIVSSPLPQEPDRCAVDRLLVEFYDRVWTGWDGLHDWDGWTEGSASCRRCGVARSQMREGQTCPG